MRPSYDASVDPASSPNVTDLSVTPGHVGGGPGLVHEHEAPGIES